MIELCKKYISWWKKKLNIPYCGLFWISFIREILIGILIYRFMII